MKKIYALFAGALLSASLTVSAQSTPRVVLLEEFTGENCNPCAGVNPYVKRFVDLNATDSFIHIAYQVPIPSAGPIYNSYKTDANNRMTYYNVSFAPFAKNDGLDYPVQGPTSGANSALNNMYYYFDTTSVNNFNSPPASVTPISPGFNQRRAIMSPCAISITHSYSANNDSVYAVAVVNTSDNFHAGAHNSLKFRCALIENELTYVNAPGTNGETSFEQVVRKMLPSAAGSQLVDTLLAGRSDTFTFAVKIPNYVRSKAQLRFVGWVQDDNGKEVKQAGISQLVTPTNLVEMVADHDSVPQISCTTTSTSSIGAYVTVINTGNVTINSLNVNVLSGATSLNNFTYSQPIQPGATVMIDGGPIAVPVGNSYPSITFVLSSPNGLSNYSVSIFDTVKTQHQIFGTSYQAPIVQTFIDSTVYPMNYEATNGDDIWYPSYYFASYYNYYQGHYPNRTFLGSDDDQSIYFWNYFDQAGVTGDYYLEKADFSGTTKAYMTFKHAYSQYDNTTNDQVDVQVSTDCGTTWNTVWSKSGTALSTVAAAQRPNPGFCPTSAADWVGDTINMDNYAGQNNVWVRFHATSDYGDNAFIDQININAYNNVGVRDITNLNTVNVYPTPANDLLSIELAVTESAAFDINIVNTLGETVKLVANSSYGQGINKIDANISDLAAGIYNVVITSNNQKTVKRFVVAH
ncbi:MAG: T9SS type A sorting domain-containing protein [Bacteroidetes bacterium]|nr:T9SS type A sorting domain-containing protein [Bacteroidota bacterium]